METLGTLGDYFDTGGYSRPISTRSAEAQAWFDHGLAWAYGFNLEESLRCFRRAAEADPDCAMAHWGVAYAAGPYYNRQWEQLDATERPERLKVTHAAARRASTLKDQATGVERALLDAMAVRCPSDREPPDFTVWTEAYADAMRGVYREFPGDPDVCTLLADALMSRTPWKLWDLETGEPRAGASTHEVRDVLERAMAEREAAGRPAHAGMLHYYIHLMEMSPTPEAALRAGDELFALSRDCGHLHHMPTHVDFQCGRYHEVVSRNSAAIARNRKYFERYGALNLYSYARIHDIHFKLYGALFLGHYRAAMEAVEEFEETVPEALIRIESPPMADMLEGYYGLKLHALIRFGRWREILAEPLPPDPDLYLVTTAVSHYAKTAAHAALGDVAAAEREKDRFDAAVSRVPPTRTLFNNVWLDVFEIASAMLRRRGRIPQGPPRRRLRPPPEGDPARGRAALRRAVGLDAARAACARRPAPRAGQGRRGGDRLSRGPGVRRAHHPGAPPSRQRLEPARPPRVPPAPGPGRRGVPGRAALSSSAIARSDVPIRSSCFCRLTHGA